jgi:U3 small nucleolar ribonucleoprotein protein IMP3
MRRYHIQNREDYQSYNRLCGSIRGLAHKLAQLPEQDPFRSKYEGNLLSKLYDMGILDITAKVGDIEDKVTVSALCRRRLAVVMCRLKMCETVSKVSWLSWLSFCPASNADFPNQLIGRTIHRTRPDPITDPAFLVTRHMEDFVTWVDTSKLKRVVMSYNDELDDFDLM